MKTLIATMAVLFTMATAASATTREPLGNCLIGAFVGSIATNGGVSEDVLYDYLMSDVGASQREQVINQANKKVEFIVASKYAEEPLSYVLDMMSTEDNALNLLEAQCVIDYYSESA